MRILDLIVVGPDSEPQRGMIEHHTGAVAMAKTELADGTNPAARQLATNIQTSQTAEIAEMRGLLGAS